MAIVPTREQITEFLGLDLEGEIVMLNLLKYRERADDGDGSGEDAYAKYADAARRMVAERGGRLLWTGRAVHTLIGEADDDWDVIALVAYPSRDAFIEMTSNKEYQEAHKDREAGLERTVLIASKAAAVFGDEG